MSNEHSKLNLQHSHIAETASIHPAQHAPAAREFASVEDLIRADREQTELPSRLAQRLSDSVQQEPKPERSWWKRLLRL